MKHIADEFGDDPDGIAATSGASLDVTGPVILWQSSSAPAAWYFLVITRLDGDRIKQIAGARRNGFGSIRVEAVIGKTRWKTSLFPHKDGGGFMLPLKADVRKKERLAPDMVATATLSFS